MQLKFKEKLKTHFWTGPIGIGTCTNIALFGRLNFQISEISVIASKVLFKIVVLFPSTVAFPVILKYNMTATTENNKTKMTKLHINKSLSE